MERRGEVSSVKQIKCPDDAVINLRTVAVNRMFFIDLGQINPKKYDYISGSIVTEDCEHIVYMAHDGQVCIIVLDDKELVSYQGSNVECSFFDNNLSDAVEFKNKNTKVEIFNGRATQIFTVEKTDLLINLFKY
jgi:hypothetical protein